MPSKRTLRLPGGRKRDLRKLRELVYEVSEDLTTLLEHSRKCEEPWGAGFITDTELTELWEKPHHKGSYLDRITALLRLYETEKAHIRSHCLKSVSTLILSSLFKFDSDWKTILRENNTSVDTSLPVTEHDRCMFQFLNLRQLGLFVQRQYVFLPYSIKEMEAATQRNNVEPAISDQYRLPFYGVGEPLRVRLTREKIPKGLLVFKDGSRSQQAEFKDVKKFEDFDRSQFIRECRTQSLLKGSVNLHPNIFLCFSCISITNGPAFIIMDPSSCNLRKLLRGEEQPPAEQLRNQPCPVLHEALGVASALEWLHMENETWLKCMHMNLNPENILVFFHEEPGKGWKISDFSMSVTRLTGEPDSESSEPWIPTAREELHAEYQAPEVTFTPNQVECWSDVWSFGCILMEVLAFVTGGAPKVKELQEIRYETEYRNTFWSEFEGRDYSLRITIRDWLTRIMGENPFPWQRDWQNLTLDILQGREDRRPSASEVYRRLVDIIGVMHGNQHDTTVQLASRRTPNQLVPPAVQHNEQTMVPGGMRGNTEVNFSDITGPDTPSSTTVGLSVHFIKINRWLDSCEEQIRRDTTASIELYKGLKLHSRVIDVIRLRVVSAPNRCRYVALSYVWGGAQKSTLRKDNESYLQRDGTIRSETCSKTIWDAIILCRGIGERYLWVDSLCIVQDTEHKHAEIEAMEAVYRGAVFTIVAAAGNNADAGLPGVSDTRDTPDTGNQEHNADPYSFDTAVNSSTWNTRAWTYQERILSKRLLFFTSGQMFFHCSHGSRCELDLGDPHYALPSDQNTQPSQSDSYKLELEHNINFNTYAQVTQEYSKRVLTREDDIENAFGGIKKVISLLFDSDVIFCMPVAALDISLLWYPATGLLQRRCVARAGDTLQGPFPSWSWAGWVGPVYYRDLVNISERTVSCLRWRQPEDSRPLYASWFGKNTPSWPQHEDWHRQITRDGRPYYTKRNGNPSHWFCHPIGRSIHDPVPIDRNTGQLFFLADKAQSVSWRMDLETSDSNTLRIFHHGSGYQLGKVFMQVRHNSKEKYELLKISSTTVTDGEKDPAWNGEKAQFSRNPGEPAWNWKNPDTSSALEWFDPEFYDASVCFCLYNVLVTVVRHGINYRVGIGKIHMHAFDEVAIKDQEIQLG